MCKGCGTAAGGPILWRFLPNVAARRGNGSFSYRGLVPVDDEQFESLLDQVRELHRLADEATSSPMRLHAHVRARLGWSADVPSVPTTQLKIADDVVDVLASRRLSRSQLRELEQTFFGK
jgi:hypothetical protein